MKRFLIFLLALGAAATLLFIYFMFTPFAIEGVAVSSRPSCDDAMDGRRRVSSSWKDGALLVEVSEAKTCGLALQSVAVQRIGRRLFVRTSYDTPNGMLAACLCRHDFSLKVPDVPRQNYNVIVYDAP
jgi:hypothetical protein